MEKSYDPKEVEPKIYKHWEENGFFKPRIQKGKAPFTVAIPPPNVTGSLHMGHALENTIIDLLVRWHRMKGEPALMLAGTDHAAIATQNKVEQKLKKEGTTRFKIGREAFLQEALKWKNQYEENILGQLKTLGCSCDWSRTRFTMDREYSLAVYEAFEHYWKKNLLYRGLRLVNWCSRCGTSISDLEVEHKEHKGSLYFIKYPLAGGGEVVVATTRPETMLGDTAVAVNPNDIKYKKLIGKNAILPLQKREIPIIADHAIDKKFGTGAVKITPAHDLTDSEIGERHQLAKISVIGKDGKMTKDAGPKFEGLDRFEAREKVITLLKAEGRLAKIEDYQHNIGHCYRCDSIIEPLLSEQWFLSMKSLAKPAIEAVTSKQISFVPQKWEKIYLNWMSSIRDWCISRQLWWGHQLPVWYCQCGEIIVSKDWATEELSHVSRETLKKRNCPQCGKNVLTRDPDVLDTWFSSALWPFAVFGWPQKTTDFEYFYPVSLMTSARDILYLWDARMIFSGLEFTRKVPFPKIYIHPTVLTKEGKRMSKSLGTGIDPLLLIEKYGTDSTRFGLIWQMAQGQDMKFGEDGILNGKRFANKIWNASRFTLMNLEDYPDVSRETSEDDSQPGLTQEDKKIIEKLNKTIENTEKYLQTFNFQHALEEIYNFFWHEFCDQYIEATKLRIRENQPTKPAAQYTLHVILENSLKLLHPFMPFVTEEIWQNYHNTSLIVASWPKKISVS